MKWNGVFSILGASTPWPCQGASWFHAELRLLAPELRGASRTRPRFGAVFGGEQMERWRKLREFVARKHGSWISWEILSSFLLCNVVYDFKTIFLAWWTFGERSNFFLHGAWSLLQFSGYDDLVKHLQLCRTCATENPTLNCGGIQDRGIFHCHAESWKDQCLKTGFLEMWSWSRPVFVIKSPSLLVLFPGSFFWFGKGNWMDLRFLKTKKARGIEINLRYINQLA